MRKLLKEFWNDQDGMILSSEVILVGTILVLGSIVGTHQPAKCRHSRTDRRSQRC